MKIKVLSLFPEMFAPMNCGIIGNALKKGLIDFEVVNIRDYTLDKHKHVDDYPFGGGAGMVMAVQPIADAINAVDPDHEYHRIYLSPRGRTFCQSVAKEYFEKKNLLFLCGSYEGVDQRVIDLLIDEELSIGDFVLTSGELASMCVINTVARFVDGVLGSSASLDEESFSDNLLEYPQYTRPQTFMGVGVPEVLLSGNHAEIAKWRREKRIEITKERRPDLLNKDK